VTGSKDLVGVDLPSRFRNAHVALVLQLYIQLLVIWVFVGDDGLLVVAFDGVAIGEEPSSIAIRFVVGESAFIDCAVRELPSPSYELVISPISSQFTSCLLVHVGALSVLLSEHPPSRITVLVGIGIGTLSMLDTILPLT
jgi:hypothetical protein